MHYHFIGKRQEGPGWLAFISWKFNTREKAYKGIDRYKVRDNSVIVSGEDDCQICFALHIIETANAATP